MLPDMDAYYMPGWRKGQVIRRSAAALAAFDAMLRGPQKKRGAGVTKATRKAKAERRRRCRNSR